MDVISFSVTLQIVTACMCYRMSHLSESLVWQIAKLSNSLGYQTAIQAPNHPCLSHLLPSAQSAHMWWLAPFWLFRLESPAQRRHISCMDSPSPGSNSTTSVRPEVKFVPWKSSRSNIQLASASMVNPPPSVLSNPTAARWSKT